MKTRFKTELPLAAGCAYACFEIATIPGGPTWQQCTCALGIALVGAAYTFGRSWVKAAQPAPKQSEVA